MTDVIKIIEEKENKEKNEKRSLKGLLLEVFDLLAFLVFVGGIVLFVRFFIFNPYTVVGVSMEPTFDEKDFIIVDKVTPRFSEYQRGDIVVFVPPGKDVPYIKRIIGLPGDKVKIDDGDVYLCEQTDAGESCTAVQEDYLPSDTYTKASCNITEFDVTDEGYFVLGDNRNHSTDSRCCFGVGCYKGSNYLVPDNYIIGKVSLRVYPEINRF